MSPHRLIHGAAFGPETIEILSQAYDAAVMLVGKDQPAIVLETIAKRIIDFAGSGERDPKKIVEHAVLGVERFSGAV